MKKPLVSVTKSDCRWDYYRGSGPGGQHKNKTSSAVRCTHEPSGAVGKAEDGRSQAKNKVLAFKRMVETKEFQQWIKLESARRMGLIATVEEKVDKAMHPSKIKVETKEEGRWVENERT